MGTFWLSCGHGAGDTGAVANFGGQQYQEHDVAVGVVNRAREILAKQGTTVELVPQEMKLGDRIIWINKNVPPEDILIECHMNSGAASGAEMYYNARNNADKTLADKLLKMYVRSTGQVNRGAKADSNSQHPRLAICRDLKCTGLLLEMGFITTQSDLEIVLAKSALGVANIVLSWMNKPFLDTPTAKQEVSPWATESVNKAKTLIGPHGTAIWTGWDRPQDEVQAFTLANVFYKLGVRSTPNGVLTNEETAVCFDRLGLFTKK